MLHFMAWSLFHAADAGSPVKAGGKGKDKGTGKSEHWGQLVRSLLTVDAPPQDVESLHGDVDSHAGTDFEEEESETEGALHTPDEGLTAEDTARWDAIVATARAPGPLQTQDAAVNTQPSSSTAPAAAVADLGSRPGYIDPTAGLTPEDRQYLRSLPAMNHFINMIELHDWEAPPDAAFTMACAGLLRKCLQDEGHSLASIRSLAGEMLHNHQQPHPPAEAQASNGEGMSASSTRSRSRTLTRPIGRDHVLAILDYHGMLQAGVYSQTHELTAFFTMQACSCSASLYHADFERMFASQNFLRRRAKCYVRRLPLASRRGRHRRRRKTGCKWFLCNFWQPFLFILAHLTVGIFGIPRTCPSLTPSTKQLDGHSPHFRLCTRSGPKSGGTRILFRYLIIMTLFLLVLA